MGDEETKRIEFGIFEESHLSFKSKNLGTIVPFRYKEYLVIGPKNLTRFENTLVKETYPYALTALYRHKEYGILIGVTAHDPQFIILFESDLNRHMYTNVKTDDSGIFNIIFSKKSSTIITAGNDIKTWKFKYRPSTCRVVFEYPTIEIELITVISPNCFCSILNPPLFDDYKDELLLNDYKGNINRFNLKGRKTGVAINYGCTDVDSFFAFNSETRQIISNNLLQGAVIWYPNGSNSEPTFLHSSAAMFIHFIDDEYVLVLDARNMFTILDIKTRHFFHLYKFEQQINRIFYFSDPTPRIFIISCKEIYIFRIVLPWNYWCTTGCPAVRMSRINKSNEAARVFVQLYNSQVRLLSPINSRMLTGITLKTLSNPIGHLYDRGVVDLPDVHHDQIILPLDNGTMQFFSTGTNPCSEINCIENLKILCICQCIYKGKWCFVCGTATGNLIFYDYVTMRPSGRIVAYPAAIHYLFYHQESDSLLIVLDDRVLRMILYSEKVFESFNISPSNLFLFFDGILFFAKESGKIRSVCIKSEEEIERMNRNTAMNSYKNVNSILSNKNGTNLLNLSANLTNALNSNTNLANAANKSELNSSTNLANVVNKSGLNSSTNLSNAVNINRGALNSKTTIENLSLNQEVESTILNDSSLDLIKQNYKLLLHGSNGMKMHDSAITGLSLGSVFFVSSSLDKTLRVWNRKDFTLRCIIILPLPLKSCCVLNGKRDVLVATEKEIMIVSGTYLFDGQIDPEDIVYDNYDQKQDSLYTETTVFYEEEEEVVESVFDRKKQEEAEETKPQYTKQQLRRRRIADALRRQEEEERLKLKKFLEEKQDPEYQKKLERILQEAKENQKTKEEEKEKEEVVEKKEEENEYSYEEDEEDEKEEVNQAPQEPQQQEENSNKQEEKPKEVEKQKKPAVNLFEKLDSARKPSPPKTPQTPKSTTSITNKFTNKTNSIQIQEKSTKKQKQKKVVENKEPQKKKKLKNKEPSSHLINNKKTKATNTDAVSTSGGQLNFGPGFSKVVKQRRYPTPLKDHKNMSYLKRPNSTMAFKKQKRAKTPDMRIPIIIHMERPPFNILFDIEMIKRMVESGNMAYAPILDYLRRHGLLRDGNTWDVQMTIPMMTMNSTGINRSRSQMPIPIGDYNDEVQMRLQKSQIDELLLTINIFSPTFMHNGKIPGFQPKIVPHNQTQMDAAMYANTILANQKQKRGQLSSNQLAMKREELRRKQESRRYSLMQIQQQHELARLNTHRQLSSPPISSTPSTDPVDIQNLIPEENTIRIKMNKMKNSNSVDQFGDDYLSINDNDDSFRYIEQPNPPNTARNGRTGRRHRFQLPEEKPEAEWNRNMFPVLPTQQSKQEQSSSARFVEPILPFYLRASGEIFLCKQKLSPFACKRYTLVVNENGEPKREWSAMSPPTNSEFPPQARKPSTASGQKSGINRRGSLIEQVNRIPRTVTKPLTAHHV